MWKIVNVTPIFKKCDIQLINNYRPISLLPICGKYFEKTFTNLCNNLSTHHLATKNRSGFRPGDSPTNQLIDLHNEKSHEVRVVFLDIYKAFKVWHDGLIFKMRQNCISGRLLKLFQS